LKFGGKQKTNSKTYAIPKQLRKLGFPEK